MKIFNFIILISCFIAVNASAQVARVDSALVKKIDTMFKDDQFWRKEFMKINKKEHSDYTAETINEKWAVSDSLNEQKAKAVINRFGYPGYDVAGKQSDTFFWIVQHCDNDTAFQEKVLVLMKAQIAKNNAGKENFAYLTDRVLVNKHQPQIYGTQVHINPQTHKGAPFPLKYPGKVNALRKEMGLEHIEAYLKQFN